MKIALVIRKLNIKGGVQRVVLHAARGLALRGHEVTVYAQIYEQEKTFGDLCEGVRIVSLQAKPSGRGTLGGYWHEERLARALARRIDPETEILNPHQDRFCYITALLFRRRHPASRVVWAMDDLPTRRFMAMRESAMDASRTPSLAKRVANWFFDGIEYLRFIRKIDAIMVLDWRDEAWANEYFGKKAIIVRAGIDACSFAYAPRAGITRRPVRLLMSGIFSPHRRFEDGIEAVRLLRERGVEATLDIIGAHGAQDPYYERVRGCIEGARLSRQVQLRGLVTDAELAEAYHAADIFLFPNHLQSWGLAVFEAMASGLSAVVSRTAGASEVLADGETALIVEPLAPAALADAIERLVKDPALYERLSRQGRALALRDLTWERMVTAMEALFASAASPYAR